MEYRNLGNSALKVSLVGLGCNNFGSRLDLEGTRKVMHKAIDLGITLFDTADAYGNRGGTSPQTGGRGASEALMGEALGPRRKDVVLATKFGLPMQDRDDPNERRGARAYIMSAAEASLKRLKTDWIDLYQYHRPDNGTPLEDTLRALDDLVRQGKVRFIGCSNLPAWRVADAAWISKSAKIANFVSAQDEYSMVVCDVENELLPAAKHFGVGFLPYFPLASGLLTGKYKSGVEPAADTRMAIRKEMAGRYMTEANLARVERWEKFARAKGRTMLELAFSWLAARPQVASVIAGATKPEQVEQNAKAADWKLTPAEIEEIDKG